MKKEKETVSKEFLGIVFLILLSGISCWIYLDSEMKGISVFGRLFNSPSSIDLGLSDTKGDNPTILNSGLSDMSSPAPSIISRVITYSLEGNWEINATVKYRRQEDNTTYNKDYHYRLIVQKEPPNSGVVIHFGGAALKIVGLTKNGNEFTIQSESMIFVGDVLFEGRLIERDKMEGTCYVAFTESRSKPTSMKFTGYRVDHFNIKNND